MKVDRLTPGSRQPAPLDRPRASSEATVQQVELAEAVAPDRRQSLRQDLEEIEAQAVGPFEGQELIQQQAHELAEKLAHRGMDAVRLVRTDGNRPPWHVVDDQA